MKKKFTIIAICLCILCLFHQSAGAQIENNEQEEQEYGDADHSQTEWYKELNSSNPNFFKIRDFYTDYFKNHDFEKSPQTKLYERFIASNMGNIDSAGKILPFVNNHLQADQQEAFGGGVWKQLFMKWNTTQGNAGTGVIRSIKIDPGNTSNILAGGALCGIWKTTDKGNTWNFVSGGVPEVGWVNDIMFVKADPKIAYAATDRGIIKSTDGGNSWFYTALNIASNYPQSYDDFIWLGMATDNANQVYASLQEGGKQVIKLTTNGGTSWTTVYTAPGRIIDMKVKPNDANVVYILMDGGSWKNCWRSTDGAKTFSKINNGYPADINVITHRARLAVTPANPNVVYIATGYNGSPDKISFFKSTNSGVSFTKKCCGSASNPLDEGTGATDFTYETCHLAQLTWNFAFTVSETDEDFLACAANKIKISTDGGTTWNYDRSGQTKTGSQYDNYKSNNAHTGVHGDHHGMSVIGNEIWNSNDGGVYYSADGGNTVAKDKTDGLASQEVWGFSQAFKKDVMAVGLNHNAICYRDDNVYGGWIAVNGADAMATNVNPLDDQYMYNHPWGHERVKRSLTGKTGHQFQNLGIELGYITLDNIDFHPHLFHTMYASNYGDRNDKYEMSKSTNNAASWTVMKSFASVQKNAVAVKVSYADPKYVYAVVEPNKVWKSSDEGVTWTDISPPSSLISSYGLWRMTLSDKSPNELWVSVKGNQNSIKIIKSTDGGSTWQDYSTGLPAYEIRSMAYQRGSDDIIYAGTTFGVYYRSTGMTSWQKFGTDLPATQVNFMFINYAKGKIRIGTQRGIYENNLVEDTPPKANIAANKSITPCGEQNKIQFADYSVLRDGPTTKYAWSFPGGIPNTSSDERPQVYYLVAGSYNVTLTVTDQFGTNTQTLTNFITVTGSCNATTDIVASSLNINETSVCTGFLSPVSALITNGGINTVNSYILKVYLDGVLTQTTPRNAALVTGAQDNVTLGNFNLKSISEFKVVVEQPNGTIDNTVNNTVKVNLTGNILNIPSITVVSQSSNYPGETANMMVDDDLTTFWHNNWSANAPLPHILVFNLNGSTDLHGLDLLNRQDNANGYPKDVEVSTSQDNITWTAPTTVTFTNTSSWQTVGFIGIGAKYLKLKIVSTISGSSVCSMAELKLRGCVSGTTGIEETSHDASSEILIIPNPAQDKIRIQTTEKIEQVILIDAKGAAHPLQYVNGYYDINRFNQGLYFLKFISSTGIHVSKLIINR
jgi:PKD repeat protein